MLLEKGDLKQVEQQLAQGADINAQGIDGETPLTIAALAGQQLIVEALLKHGADPQVRNKKGMTALHAAAYGDHREIVELLLAKGADVNDAKNRFGVSPLHVAAEENHQAVVELLLANGANVEAKESQWLHAAYACRLARILGHRDAAYAAWCNLSACCQGGRLVIPGMF